jgi:NADH-quinone oxidoreductase subunit A
MVAEYLGVLTLLAAALLLSAAALAVHWFAAPRPEPPPEPTPDESGGLQGTARHRRQAVGFYVVAILYVILSAEAVYFYAWGATFRDVGWPGLLAMGLFALPLVVGLVYEWRKGALEW